MHRSRFSKRVLSTIAALSLVVPMADFAPAHAAIFNNAPAIDALGQYDGSNQIDPVPHYGKSVQNNAPNEFGFNGVYAGLVDYVNARYFQADQQNNRVLVYNLDANGELIDRIPDAVLGQTGFALNTSSLTQEGLVNPIGLAFDATRNYLFVSQGSGANRVSVFDVSAITNGEPAINVIGQPDFVTGTANVTQAGLNDPYALAYDNAGQRLFVNQISGNRVTVYDMATITNGENAVNVIGQTNFTDSAAATTQNGLNNPRGLAYDAARGLLFVSNYGAGRVTIYDVAAITDGENAVNVLGQTDFITGTAATTQAGMNQPRGLAYDANNQRLFVGQVFGNRVTVYDVATITDGENATGVLGQANFTTNAAATTQAGMNTPFDVTYNASSSKLFVANFGAHRVTIYDVAAVTNGENAVDLLGQYDGTSLTNPVPSYTRATANDAANRLGFNQPQGILVDRTFNRLFVADTGNNRVLVYNLDVSGELIDHVPDAVLGQTDFVSTVAGITQSQLNGPSAMAFDPTKNLLYVLTVNRVLIYDVTAITNGENAVNVLGQANFTANVAGNTQTGMNSPRGIALDVTGQRLFVSQNGNNRVTVYDVAAIANGEAATGVLGQFTYTATTASSTASGLNAPRGVAFDPDNQYLYVASNGNNRVTVFDVATVTNGEPAIHIIGQPNFASTAAAVTQAGIASPTGIAYDPSQKHLFVANLTAHRVTVYDMDTIVDGEGAAFVFGQPDFTTANLSNAQNGLNAATSLAIDSDNERMYTGQLGNHRISAFDTSLAGFTVTETGGSTAVTEGGATDTVDVVLTSPVFTTVTVDISLDSLSASATPATLTFTSSTWNIPQTVTIFAPADPNLVDESATLTFSVNDALSEDSYDGLADQTVAVSVTDDDIDTDNDGTIDDIDTDDDNDTVLDTVEDAGPNGGDINVNSIPDRLEDAVASMPNGVGGASIGLILSGDCAALTNLSATSGTSYAADGAYQYPEGFVSFSASCSMAGQSATATVLFFTNETASQTIARKYDTLGQTYGTILTTPAAVTIGGEAAVRFQYLVTDGGTHDQDGLADGSISDPVGLGILIPISTPIASIGGGAVVYGCKDRTASNYNPYATLQNHNSCEYVSKIEVPAIIVPPTPEPPPAICSIKQLPTTPIKYGVKNDPSQVRMLEDYLNAELGKSLPVDGLYSLDDKQAVISWQERYAEDILKPWGINQGTGFVSTYSLKKLADIQSRQCKAPVTPTKPSSSCFAPTVNLSRGDSGADVLKLQKILAAKGYLKATPNSQFGPATQAAVIAFQKAQGIDQTGTVGPLTKSALQKTGICP